MSQTARLVRFLSVIGIASFALFTTDDRVGAVAGALDPYFGSFGHQTVGFADGSDIGRAMAIQSDGKMVVVGSSTDDGIGKFGVARFNTDGSLDTTFDVDGKALTMLLPTTQVAFAVAIQSDGKIVAVGQVLNGSSQDIAVVRYNSNGSLDTTFDGDGMVITSIGTTDTGYGVAIQTDGKIVVAGTAYNSGYDFAVVRYNTDGSLDTTFDTDGKVTTQVGLGDNQAKAVVIQSDGKIVLAGWSINGPGQFAAVRYNSDGTLDSTFGAAGKVTVSVLSNDFANAVALQSDGKIIIAGDVYNGANYDAGVIRLNTNGTLDTTFSSDGKVFIGILSGNDSIASIAIQSDNKIVLAGYANNGSDNDLALIRFNSNGSFDLTFDTDGRVTIPILSGNDNAGKVAVRTDGKLLVAGNTAANSTDFLVALVNSNGSLDTTFDGDGYVNVDIGNASASVSAIAIQANGKIISAGMVGSGTTGKLGITRFDKYGFLDPAYGTGGITTTDVGPNATVLDAAIQFNGKTVVVGSVVNGGNTDMLIVRYNTDGTIDTGFDTDGIATIDLGGNDDYATAVVHQTNGKIVVAGYTSNGLDIDFAVARFNLNGTLDTTFGTGGIVTTPVLLSFDVARAAAIQSDGKIIVAGSSIVGVNTEFALVRYETDGTIDTTFGTLGRAVTSVMSGSDVVNSLTIQSDGKIIAAGGASDNIESNFGVARYETDGTLDTSFGTGGKLDTDIAASSDEARSVVVQPDGKIVVTGTAFAAESSLAIVRYLPNGALDTTFNLASAPLGTGKAAIDVAPGDDMGNDMAIDDTGRFVIGGDIGERFGIARVLGDLAPTAANVNVSGRVMTANGSGLRNAIVSITNSNGVARTVVTSSFGYFNFDDIAAGETYVVSVASKRYNFAPRTVTVSDAITDLDIVETNLVETRTK